MADPAITNCTPPEKRLEEIKTHNTQQSKI